MPEFLAISRRLDGIDCWLRKQVVKLKVLRFYLQLRDRLRASSQEFGIRITHGELFDAACRAYFELHVVDGSFEGAVYALRTRGIPSISAEMIVRVVAEYCPKGNELRTEEKPCSLPSPLTSMRIDRGNDTHSVSTPLPLTSTEESLSCGG